MIVEVAWCMKFFCYDRYADKVWAQKRIEMHFTTYCAYNAVLSRVIFMKF